jgi:hypothetical protein
MASLSEREGDPFIKFFYVGDSSSGKTGSLVSLVKAGYKLRILDMDSGVGILASYVRKECPDLIGNVDVVSFRDKYGLKPTGDIGVVGGAKAFANAAKTLDKWDDGSEPKTWGTGTFLVIDTLTTLGKSALAWAEAMSPTAKDPRQWYFTAQSAIEGMVAMLMGPDVKTNVIIITHITARELQDGTQKGFPSSGAGSALGPTLAKYCNTMVLAETSGFGDNVKRKIKTTPTGFVDLKTAAPFDMMSSYDLGTGLATIVEKLKANL